MVVSLVHLQTYVMVFYLWDYQQIEVHGVIQVGKNELNPKKEDYDFFFTVDYATLKRDVIMISLYDENQVLQNQKN